MIQKKLYFKYFSVYFLVTVILFVVSLLFSVIALNRHYNTLSQRNVEKMGYRMIPMVADFLKTGNTNALDRLFGEMYTAIGVEISLVNAERQVIATSRLSGELSPECLYSQKVSDLFRNKSQDAVSAIVPTQAAGTYLAIPIRQAGIVTYVMVFSMPQWYFFDMSKQLTGLLALFAAVAFVVALTGSLFMARSLLAPVSQIVAVTSEVAKGDFGAKIELPSDDEFGLIGDSINDMTRQIRCLFDQLSAEKEELSGLIASLQEALWVVDGKDRILFANEKFEKLAGRGSLVDEPYWQVLRSHSVDDLIRRARATSETAVEEIEIDNRIYAASARHIPLKNETVVLLYDISQIRSAEEIKRSLVTSVSHELRTPLTSILGYLEVLRSGEKDETRLKYLSVVERNAERMFYLTKDLLELSSLERAGASLEPEKIDPAALAEDIRLQFAKRFEQKGLVFETKVGKGVKLTADRFKLEQALTNLIDNAVKYTERGSVTLSIAAAEGGTLIGVQDTGIGIAAKYHDKVFERFYVVDKSRSRQEGGTGLGLSIVRQIVELHGGTLSLRSGLGQGSRFEIFLPFRKPAKN